jgi:hypothetical protein
VASFGGLGSSAGRVVWRTSHNGASFIKTDWSVAVSTRPPSGLGCAGADPDPNRPGGCPICHSHDKVGPAVIPSSDACRLDPFSLLFFFQKNIYTA